MKTELRKDEKAKYQKTLEIQSEDRALESGRGQGQEVKTYQNGEEIQMLKTEDTLSMKPLILKSIRSVPHR